MSISKKLFFCFAALTVVFLPICEYLHIVSYSTGADPSVFLTLAQDILQHRFADVVAFIDPGWPLYLAGVIRLFGIFAASWANVPLFILLLFLLWILLADLLASRTRAALAAIFSGIALLAGSGHNPHFLLWAFRQTPIYLTSLLALLFIRRATRASFDGRTRTAFAWLFASLAAVFAAVFIRETSALLLPTIFLHLLLDSGAPAALPPSAPLPPFRRRLPLLIAFCAVNLALLLGGLAAVFLLHVNLVNSQNLYIMRSLAPLLRDHLLSFPYMAKALGVVLGEFPGILGFFLLVGTVAALVRRAYRPFATLFLVPSLLNFLFEAFNKIHMRFFLTPVFYLPPLAALGAFLILAALCTLLARWRPAWRESCSGKSLHPRFALLFLGILLVWGAFVIHATPLWGPRVSRAQVRQCLQAIEEASPSPDAIVLVDPRDRYLFELLHLYSSRKLVTVTPENLAELDLSSPALFIRPLDNQSLHNAILAIKASQLLEFRADLAPAPNPHAPPAPLFVGSAPHVIYTVSAPATQSVDLPLPPPPRLLKGYPYPNLFLRIAAPPLMDAPISASLLRASAPSNPVPLSPELRPGFNDLSVPVSSLSPGEPLNLRLSSAKPFPTALPVAWNEPDALHFDLGRYIFPYHDILSPEFHEFDVVTHPDNTQPAWRVRPKVREFNKPATIELPSAFDGHLDDAPPVPSIFFTDFLLSAVHDLPGESITATVSFPDEPSVPPQSIDIPASPDETRVSFAWTHLPSDRLPPRLQLELPAHPRVFELYPENRRSRSSQLHTMDIRRVPLRKSVSLRFGDPDNFDTALLLSGFHRGENLDTPRQGSWIADQADLFLPLFPASYQLALEVDLSYLPRHFRSSRPSDFTATLDGNPIPLDFSPIDESEDSHRFRVTGTLPASAFSAPDGLHHLRFSSPPYRPADLGFPDRRTLSLFAHSLSISPLP